MKLSVDDQIGPSDGCRRVCNSAIVRLNGLTQKRCVYANEERGIVVRYKEENGKFVINKDKNSVELEVIKGDVQIIIGDNSR